jgi:hypothetical protein
MEESIAGAIREYPAGIGQGFQPRRDVDAVAEDVLALRNYIAEVDAHSELDPLLDWSSRIALDHPALHLDPAAHSIDDARELGQKPSPVFFTIRPRCSAIFGLTSSSR